MHSIKGGWVGQTFALAKCSESEGRKTRIRRSKDERKAMVHAFIKKYQKSNNGTFPSLNITHKEVGGSFYTVREIVRDLIQENRVLGPGKLTLEDQGIDQLSKQDSFDSNASVPQSFLTISLIGSYIGQTNLQVSDGVPLSHQPTLNGSQIDLNENNSDELVLIASQVNESIGVDEHSEGLLMSMENHIAENEKNSAGSVITIATDVTVEKEMNCEQEFKAANTKVSPVVLVETETNMEHNSEVTMARITPLVSDVVVETFPLRIVTSRTDILDQHPEEVMKMTGSFRDHKIESIDLGKNDEISETEISSAKNSGLMDGQTTTTLKNTGDLPMESLNGSLIKKEGIESEKNGCDKGFQVNDVENIISHPKCFVQDQTTEGAKAVNGLSDIENEAGVNTHHSNEPEKEISPSLDRINRVMGRHLKKFGKRRKKCAFSFI